MKRYIKIWRKPTGEMVSIPVRSSTGKVGDKNGYGWELIYVGSLCVSTGKSFFHRFDLSKYVDLKDLLTFSTKGIILVYLYNRLKK